MSNKNKMPSWVVCAAIKSRTTGAIVLGARHFDFHMREQIKQSKNIDKLKNNKKLPAEWIDCEFGFIDQYGNFLSREEAWIMAKKNGQIRRSIGFECKQLYSENLY